LAALQKNLVFGGPGVVNNDYEGEISGPGNVVHITQFGDPTITSYTPNSTITYQTLNDAGLDLNIDQAYSFSFSIDDVDRRQAAGDMQSYLEERASYQLANTADTYIAGLYTGVATNNTVGTSSVPITPALYASSTPADFYQKVLLPLKVELTEANIPMQGRYVVVPPWAEGLLEQTQAFIAITDMQGQPSQVFQTGMIGRCAGFDIYVSNNAINYSGSDWIVQAGHPMAITYGEQIVQTEALRLQTTFADGVRGLHVFGAKLVRPDAIAVAYVARPSGI
jgi:P22 coat protein - gene protein 5